MSKPFCENRRGARCFAELFGTLIRETIHAGGIYMHDNQENVGPGFNTFQKKLNCLCEMLIGVSVSTTLDPNNVCPSSFQRRSYCQVPIPYRIHFKKNAR
jgi:hypothetical protein